MQLLEVQDLGTPRLSMERFRQTFRAMSCANGPMNALKLDNVPCSERNRILEIFLGKLKFSFKKKASFIREKMPLLKRF